MQHERDDEADAQDPQQHGARQQVAGHVAQRLAVEVDLLLREKSFRLPIRWTTTKPMSIRPVTAMTHFLPTDDAVEAHERRARSARACESAGPVRPAASFAGLVGGVAVVAIVSNSDS